MALDIQSAQNMMLRSVQDAEVGKLAGAKARLQMASRNPNKIEEAAKEFESVFISQMLSHMFSGVEVDPLFGGGHAEEMYRSLLVDEYGKVISQAGGIGLADHVKQELLSLQEVGA